MENKIEYSPELIAIMKEFSATIKIETCYFFYLAIIKQMIHSLDAENRDSIIKQFENYMDHISININNMFNIVSQTGKYDDKQIENIKGLIFKNIKDIIDDIKN